MPRGRALLLSSLRCAALAAVIFFLLEPSLIRQRRERYTPTVAVAVDTSMSMGIRDGGGESRLRKVRQFLSSEEFGELSEGYFLERYLFSDGASRDVEDGAGEDSPDGTRTDIGAALEQITEQAPASLGAVVVFTDGGHEEGSAARPLSPDGREIPVLFVALGGGEELRDLEVAEVSTAGLAFAGKPVVLEVTVRAQGFEGRRFPLLLKESGRAVLSEDLVFDQPRQERVVELEWTPPRPGTYHLSVEVPLQADEEIRENNRVDLSLEAARDKIRILLVSGRPSWNHRFLRDALKGDPSIDLVSFIILRTATDAVNVPQEELSLIPFPTRKIFLEELDNFDLIVFDNFSFRFYFPPQYLEKVKEFVAGGGGFWMLGGSLSFSGGGYAGTPLEEVLPVSLSGTPAAGGYTSAPFTPALTPSGETHPFFQGLRGMTLSELPKLDGYNASGPVRAGAVSLLQHVREDGGAQAVLAIGRYGEGRTLALLTDSLWKWNFEMVGRGRGNYFYLSLVRQAVRWSVGDPQVQPLRVSVERERLVPGEKVRGAVRVLGEDYLPASSPDLEVLLKGGSGSSRILPVVNESPGLFTFEAEVAGEGTYEVEARVSRGGDTYGTARAAVRVSWPSGEFRNPGMNRPALERLLAGREGEIIEFTDHAATADLLAAGLARSAPVYRVTYEEKKGLGQEWWAFALVVSLLGVEWTVRKRRGLD